MVNVMNQAGQSTNSSEPPLSAIFSNGNFLDESLFKNKNEKVQDFVKLCEPISIDELSEDEIAHKVVESALAIEFGIDQELDSKMVDTITQALLSDPMTKKQVFEFVKDHFHGDKIRDNLIN